MRARRRRAPSSVTRRRARCGPGCARCARVDAARRSRRARRGLRRASCRRGRGPRCAAPPRTLTPSSGRRGRARARAPASSELVRRSRSRRRMRSRALRPSGTNARRRLRLPRAQAPLGFAVRGARPVSSLNASRRKSWTGVRSLRAKISSTRLQVARYASSASCKRRAKSCSCAAACSCCSANSASASLPPWRHETPTKPNCSSTPDTYRLIGVRA